MIKIIFNIFLFFLGLQTCNSQNIKIVINDNKINFSDSLQVSIFINKNHVLPIEQINNREYILSLNNFDNELLVSYKSKSYKLIDLNKQVKIVYIDYDVYADEECYVIHEVYSDVIQSNQMSLLKDCIGITNIYYTNSIDYNPLNSIKVRKKDTLSNEKNED